jgi:beta-lactamase class A
MDGIIGRPMALPARPVRQQMRLAPMVLQSQAVGIMMDGIRRPQPMALPTVAEVLNTVTPGTVNEGLRWRWIGMGMAVTAVALSGIIARNVYLNTHAPAISHTASAAAATATPTAPTPDQVAVAQAARVQQTLAAATAGQPISAVIINLKTGQTSSINGGQQFVSASLYKLFVALSIYKEIDAGTLTLSSGVPGTGQNVGSCLNAMITVSDNTCGEGLGAMVGWERQNSELHNLGFTTTFLESSSNELTSASDVALFYQRLYGGTLLSPNTTGQFLDLLKAQRINNRLPADLPAGTVVAHKTGDLNALVHDAGIVYSPNGDYVISLMSGPWNNLSNAAPALATVSAQVYGAINTPATK